MPTGDIKVLERVMSDIADAVDDFVVLSIHNDIDLLTLPEHKSTIARLLESHEFKGDQGRSYRRIKCLYHAEIPIQYHDHSGCHIDLKTGLYYGGLEPNTLVPVDSEFQEYVYKSKVKTGDIWKYRLSPESNVVHTVYRIIFDKKNVPKHYRRRLEENLLECNGEELRLVFDMVLFKFGKRAFELVINKKFDSLIEEYVGYSDY